MLTLRIALRYLFSKKSHNAVNVISVISMAGVAVATMAMVCVLSVFNGFADLAYGRLSMVDPQIKIEPVSGKVIANGDSIAGIVSSLPSVAKAVATVSDQALAMFGNRQMAVTIHGVPEGYAGVTDVERAVIDGMYLLDDGERLYATLSVGVAIRLGVRPGMEREMALYVPRRVGNINPANPMAAFRADSLTVAAVYEVEESDHDASTVLVPVEVARNLLDYTTESSAVEVALIPGADEKQAVEELRSLLGPDFVVKNRLEQESSSFKMISVEKWITFVMLAFILVIASFNVITTLSMLIIEKSDNMLTLRSLGATAAMVRGIFMWEGWLVSMVGGLSGIVLGVVLCLAQQYGGFIKLGGDPSQLSISEYPVRVAFPDLLAVIAVVVVVGLVISMVTACFAASGKRK